MEDMGQTRRRDQLDGTLDFRLERSGEWYGCGRGWYSIKGQAEVKSQGMLKSPLSVSEAPGIPVTCGASSDLQY